MNKPLIASLGLCAAVSSAMAGPPGSPPPCNAQTTKGSWMYTCEGTLPAPTQTNARILGNCSASKTGYFSCQGSVNLGGQILAQGLNGQAYTLPNCTGTISYTQTVAGYPAPALDINYVVSEGGDAINGLPTNSGGVLSCTLKRIDKGSD